MFNLVIFISLLFLCSCNTSHKQTIMSLTEQEKVHRELLELRKQVVGHDEHIIKFHALSEIYSEQSNSSCTELHQLIPIATSKGSDIYVYHIPTGKVIEFPVSSYVNCTYTNEKYDYFELKPSDIPNLKYRSWESLSSFFNWFKIQFRELNVETPAI